MKRSLKHSNKKCSVTGPGSI